MVTMTALHFCIMALAVFAALVAAPFLVDYVFFVLHDEASWFWASVCTAILLCVPLVILLGFMV